MTTPHRATIKACLLGAVMTLMVAAPSASMAQDAAGKRVERERHTMGFPMQNGAHHFERLDTNKDGSISQDEYLSRHMERFKALDTNNDGKISSDEFKARYERKRPSMADRPDAGAAGKQPAKK